jgi:hypothetical protein
MKHHLFPNKTILVGDDAADALIEYVTLAANNTADRRLPRAVHRRRRDVPLQP